MRYIVIRHVFFRICPEIYRRCPKRLALECQHVIHNFLNGISACRGKVRQVSIDFYSVYLCFFIILCISNAVALEMQRIIKKQRYTEMSADSSSISASCLLLLVLSYCSLEDLWSARLVCKKWYLLMSNEQFWRLFYENHFRFSHAAGIPKQPNHWKLVVKAKSIYHRRIIYHVSLLSKNLPCRGLWKRMAMTWL
jgi:hypothetical protein